MGTVLLMLAVMLTGTGPGDDHDPAVRSKFQSFCAEWMEKLAVRERDNRAGIRWQTGPDGVRGEYVGYSRDHVCRLKPPDGPKAVPVGTIIYHERLYRQAGASTAEAAQNPPSIVEDTEVTEIFRYGGGKWVY